MVRRFDFRCLGKDLLTPPPPTGVPQHEAHHKETRCHLEFSERHLTVTYIKKDEGFESDTESAKSVEPPSSACLEEDDKPVSGVEEKIIKDHVFRYSESGTQREIHDEIKPVSRYIAFFKSEAPWICTFWQPL